MTLSLSWITTLMFISIRLGTVLLFTPIQAIRQLPVPVRILLVFMFSGIMVNFIPPLNPVNNNELLLGSLAEFANGLILATSVYAAFAVFQIAGQLIDSEIGLNSLVIFNPAERTQEPLTSRLLGMLAVLYFFGLDGHVWLLKGLAYSFIIIPPGTIDLFAGFTPVVKQFGFMFSMAFMLASPVIMALLAIDLFGAVITRNMPQISTYFLTLPIKILVGLMILALMLDYINPLTDKVFTNCFQTWQEIML